MSQNTQQLAGIGGSRERDAGLQYWLFLVWLKPSIMIALLCGFGVAAAGEQVGEIVSALGTVEVLREGRWHALKPGDAVAAGGVVRTGAGSRAAVQLANGTQLKLNAHSHLELKAITPHAQGFIPTSAWAVQNVLRVLSGEVWIRNSGEPLEIQTMPATATVRGTELNLAVGPDELTSLAVLEGLVELSNPQGSVTVAANEQATAKLGEAPRKTVLLNPLDAVQWTLYYPGHVSYRDYPLTSLAPSRLKERAEELERRLASAPQDANALVELGEVSYDLGKRKEAQAAFEQALRLAPTSGAAHTGLGWVYLEGGKPQAALGEFHRVKPASARALVGKALALYQLNRLDEAEQVTAEAKRRFPSSTLPNTQAALNALVRGEPELAMQAFDRALTLDPNSGVARGLQSNIHLVQNRKQPALDTAEQAIRTNPSSPSAYLALSVAKQAEFELDSALEAARKVVELDPENPQARIQEARLLFGMGRTREAYAIAQEARRLSPKDSMVESTWGFILLARNQVDEAIAAFKEAIALDTTRGEPHLGLGLALFRRNRTEAAVAELRKASLLESQVSLYQSYLGKAFYEVKNDPLAAKSLNRAKQLDPRDPTPFFYDAIRLQSINRPVEALEDLQQSIALNDNRAVYRSRLLLDEDLAARSASLARIYDSLGFDRLAQLEASRSLALDPSNFSAHRFLADSYANRPRHEIARVSELLQAQLLQPVNINPVQPHLALSDAGAGLGAGSTSVGINEFTPLFERNRLQLLASGVGGSNGTIADEVALSGLYDRFSASLGQYHSETDGFRPNNDVENDVYNAFFQLAATPDFNVQGEYRWRETKHGDVNLRFDLEDFSGVNRRNVRQSVSRIGAHLSLSPRSDAIVSAFYGEFDEDQDLFGIANLFTNDKGYQVEAQYLFRGNRFNLTAGGGIYRIDVDQRLVLNGSLVFDDDFAREQETVYVSTDFRWPDAVTWTAGLSYDHYEARGQELVDTFSPRLGMQWDITDQINLRLAYAETTKRALLADQSIEPTQVAGFNQRFDDFNGTLATGYGIGLTAHIDEKLYGGIEASRRDLNDIPFYNPDIEEFEKEMHVEDLYRAYVYWTPHARWAVSAETSLEKFEIEERVVADARPSSMKTFSAPLAVQYSDPSGFFARLGAVYVSQEVEPGPLSKFGSENDDFVLVDASIGYRLPKRSGIISVGVSNLLDEKFSFHDDNFRNSKPLLTPRFSPDRTFLAHVTLAF